MRVSTGAAQGWPTGIYNGELLKHVPFFSSVSPLYVDLKKKKKKVSKLVRSALEIGGNPDTNVNNTLVSATLTSMRAFSDGGDSSRKQLKRSYQDL